MAIESTVTPQGIIRPARGPPPVRGFSPAGVASPSSAESAAGTRKVNLDELATRIWSKAGTAKEKTANTYQAVKGSETAQKAASAAKNASKATLVGGGMVVGYGASKLLSGLRGITRLANPVAAERKATGALPLICFILAVMVHIRDATSGFPRSGGLGILIIGFYLGILIAMVFGARQPWQNMWFMMGMQIVIPWILIFMQNLPGFGFLNFYRQPIIVALVGLPLVAISILQNTDMERDTIARWLNYALVFYISVTLVWAGVEAAYASLQSVGSEGVLPTQGAFQQLRKDFGANSKKIFSAMVNFIPGLVSEATASSKDEPPPVRGVGAPTTIALASTGGEITLRGNTKAKIALQIVSPDNTAYQFERKCRIIDPKLDAKTDMDKDNDGIVDWDKWRADIGTSPYWYSSRVFFCPLTLADVPTHLTNDAQVEFGIRYDVDVTSSYSTYFVLAKREGNTIITPYANPQEFFMSVLGSNAAPVAQDTNKPCSLSIDNSGVEPPIDIVEGEADYTVPLTIWFNIRTGAQTTSSNIGNAVIDEIKQMQIVVPPGITDLICEDDPTLLTRSGPQTYTLRSGKNLHGKSVRMDCEGKVDRNDLQWTGQYAQSTFQVSATCSMIATQRIKVKVERLGTGGSGGGVGAFTSAWDWPVQGARVLGTNSCFGNQIDPINDQPRWHNGLDLSVAEGTPIHPVEAGTVSDICLFYKEGDCGGYGNIVLIAHDRGYSTFYGHMLQVNAAIGDKVTPSTVIGLVGSTGYSTGPHLHFGVSMDDNWNKDVEKNVDPLCVLKDAASTGCPAPTHCPVRAGSASGSPVHIQAEGLPDAGAISRFEGDFPVTGYSGTLKQMVDEIGGKTGVDKALLAAIMHREGGMQPNCHEFGLSSLTGCGWPGSYCQDGCSDPDLCKDDYSQVMCTANIYSNPPSFYDQCLDKSGADKYKCIMCIYAGAKAEYTSSGSCAYADVTFANYWGPWQNYYAQGAS